MQDLGKRYPYAGYGGRFRYWLREKNPKPYGMQYHLVEIK
jgi:hypothetical protein